MIRLKLDRIFEVKGIKKPFNFLLRMGNSSGYATKLINGRAISISFEKLELLCTHFNCTPNDLLDYVPDAKNALPEAHSLHSISKKDTIGAINKLLHELPMEKIEELYGMLKK